MKIKNIKNVLPLYVAVVLASVACNSNQHSIKEAMVNDSATTYTTHINNKEEIVYVNIDSLQKDYAYFNDIRKKLESNNKARQQQFESKAMAFQKEAESAQQRAQYMTPQQQQELGNSLQQKEQDLIRLQQSLQAQVAQEEMQELNNLHKRISTFLKKYAQENGYRMILSYSEGNSAILYAVTDMDITEPVLEGLNTEYAKEKKSKK